MSDLPNVSFGTADAPLPDWRKDAKAGPEPGADDEELPETPPDVVKILGFDPKELEELEE